MVKVKRDKSDSESAPQRVDLSKESLDDFDICAYRTRTIITRSRFETALVYKPRILDLKNEEFSFLVHKLSVI